MMYIMKYTIQIKIFTNIILKNNTRYCKNNKFLTEILEYPKSEKFSDDNIIIILLLRVMTW